MEFNKITEADRQGKGNVGQPDTPALSTAAMQQLMDSLPNLAIDKFNEFIDAINTAMQNSVTGESTNDQIPTAKAVWDIFDHLDSDIISAVNAWLIAHPEATTTVQDGSLTIDKFAEPVKSEIESIGNDELTTEAQTLSGAVNELNDYDKKSAYWVTPEMFGAVGDGDVDDTTALQNAFNEVTTKGVNICGNGTYRITQPIIVDNSSHVFKNIAVQFSGEILVDYTNTFGIKIIRGYGWKIKLHVTQKDNIHFGGFDFTTDNPYHYGLLNSVGVIIERAYLCDISVISTDFSVGLRLGGDGGCCYNTIHYANITNCAYGIELYAGTNGYVNNNIFTSNYVTTNSSLSDRNKAVPIHIFSISDYPNNCNLFEGDYSASDDGVCVLIEHGTCNDFYIRNENKSQCIIDDGDYNTFHSQKTVKNDIVIGGLNIANCAVDNLFHMFDKIANIDANNVDVVWWKSPSTSFYACGANELVYAHFDEYGNVTPLDYVISSPDSTAQHIAKKLCVVIALPKEKIIGFRLSSNAQTDIRWQVYPLDSNKQGFASPRDHVNRGTEPATILYCVQASVNINGEMEFLQFTNDVKYVLIGCNKEYDQLEVFVKRPSVGNVQYFPCKIQLENSNYPYFPIENINIRTRKPHVGKRLYSTVDGAEYVCTAVALDNTETWVKKTV